METVQQEELSKINQLRIKQVEIARDGALRVRNQLRDVTASTET